MTGRRLRSLNKQPLARAFNSIDIPHRIFIFRVCLKGLFVVLIHATWSIPRQFFSAAAIVIVGMSLPLFTGCGGGSGEKTVQTKGRVTNAGEMLDVERRDVGVGMVQVIFTSVDESEKNIGESSASKVLVDGSFSVGGRSGSGLPPGRYRIGVEQWDPYPHVDKLKRKFSPTTSKIIRTIDGSPIELDVSRPEG